MSFVLYSRNTVIRAYFDKYVDKRQGASLKEVADALGYTTKNISDAVFMRGGTIAIGYVRVSKARYRSTREHRDGWVAAEAEVVLEDHLSGRFRVDGMTSRVQAEKAPKAPYSTRRAARQGAEDWSGLHYWMAVLMALDELGAVLRGHAREVTTEIKPKLAEHKVTNLDLVASTLTLIKNRLGWVDVIGGDPARWYLTPEYTRLTPEERDQVLAQWDDDGNRLTPAIIEATYEEGPMAHPEDGRALVTHRFELNGLPFGTAQGTEVVIEAHLPKEMSAQERLGLFQFMMKVREDLLNLI
jgi:hypothetical protein